MKFTLLINDQAQEIDVDPDMPLLWVLRDQLHLTGTKYGCGIGQCGSCTVHLDGKAIRACQTSVSTIGNGKITTIEGITGHELHPVQQAWLDQDVPQCGYCQSGQIMAAIALLERIPAPDDTDIDVAMAGNLCRCGTYFRIKQAIRQVVTDTHTREKDAGTGHG